MKMVEDGSLATQNSRTTKQSKQEIFFFPSPKFSQGSKTKITIAKHKVE